MRNKVLILGISSFAGASFANFLISKFKYKVYGTYNKKNKLPMKFFLNQNKKFKSISLIKFNLNDKKKRLENLVNKIDPDYIFDFASICMVNESWIKPDDYYQINFFSKINLIKNLKNLKNLKKFIYISTPEVFGSNNKKINEYSNLYNPSTPYASSKLSMELHLNNYMKESDSKIIITRFSNFYGRGQPLHRLIPKLVYCINKSKIFQLHGSGETKRDFIFEDDFNSGLFKTMKKGKVNSKYHFSGNKFVTIKQIIIMILKIKNSSWSKTINKTKDRKGKDKFYFLDCKKTKKDLNWKPSINLELGLKKTVKFYDEIIGLFKDKDTLFKI